LLPNDAGKEKSVSAKVHAFVVSPLGPDDLFDLQYLRDARLSPDGRQVAYVVSRTAGEEEQFEMWIADSERRGKQRLPLAENPMAPRWSPDGRSIAFVSNGRLYVVSVSSLNVSAQLTPSHLSVQGAPSWSPDSTRIAVSLLECHIAAVASRRITSNHFRAEGLGFTDALTQRIHEVSYPGGAIRCLTPAQGVCSQPEWSPCGDRILFFATDEAMPFASYSPRLLTVGVQDGEIIEVLGCRWFIACARWLPGGDRIVVAAARDSTLTIPALSLWTVDRFGGDARLRTPGMIGHIGCWNHHDMPVWDFMFGANALSVLDRETVFASVQKGGSVEIWRIGLEGDIEAERVVTGERSCIVLDVNRAADALIFIATDLGSPTELWRWTLSSRQEQRLTMLNDGVLSRWPETTVERFGFESADGTPIEAWFMAPKDRAGPLPTVLFIHGGPFGATGYAFRYDFLLLAAQGYGVVFANFRGSAGYGEPFARAIMGDWGERGYPDHMGAADAAVAHGFADPERLGVWGPSHGGFATCWIVGHTDRFKAAIAEAAITNFATLYYLTDAPESFRRDLGGRPHEIPDVYRARSPMTYAHRCTTPTMLLHGEDDLRCPISEAEQFHRALRDVGCPTELVRIVGCSHLGDSTGPVSARRAQNEAIVSWFRRYL
jgi:dipeptidyl aminopeptidase/acylaminoacyl peptidase